jgi:protein-disulfide isomerase
MPSQKASKRRRQAAQTPPPPSARRSAGPRRASPKVLIIAGVVVVAVIVAIVLAVVLTNGSSSSDNSAAAQLPDATDVQQQFAGIPQNGNVLGKPTAPVKIVTYVDLQCPFCRQFETEALPTIIDKYVRPGKATLESRTIAILGPDSQTGRNAALAAAKQNKLFNFQQLLYDNQGTENTGWLNDSIIKSAAASIPGLNASQLLSDRNSSTVSDKAKTIDSQATEQNVNQTPTIYVVAKGGTPKLVNLTSPGDPSALEAAINAAG